MQNRRLGPSLRSFSLALLACALFLTACGGATKPAERPAPPLPVVRSALSRVTAAQHLPADTFLVIATDDIGALQTKLGWEAFIGQLAAGRADQSFVDSGNPALRKLIATRDWIAVLFADWASVVTLAEADTRQKGGRRGAGHEGAFAMFRDLGTLALNMRLEGDTLALDATDSLNAKSIGALLGRTARTYIEEDAAKAAKVPTRPTRPTPPTPPSPAE